MAKTQNRVGVSTLCRLLALAAFLHGMPDVLFWVFSLLSNLMSWQKSCERALVFLALAGFCCRWLACLGWAWWCWLVLVWGVAAFLFPFTLTGLRPCAACGLRCDCLGVCAAPMKAVCGLGPWFGRVLPRRLFCAWSASSVCLCTYCCCCSGLPLRLPWGSGAAVELLVCGGVLGACLLHIVDRAAVSLVVCPC